MKKIFNSKKFITLIAAIIVIACSWLFTCGIIKLITLCFDLNFTWSIATGIWLILVLLGSMFRGKKK